MTIEQFNIVEVTKNTAKNLHELMVQLADHINTLQIENATLRNRIAELESGNKE